MGRAKKEIKGEGKRKGTGWKREGMEKGKENGKRAGRNGPDHVWQQIDAYAHRTFTMNGSSDRTNMLSNATTTTFCQGKIQFLNCWRKCCFRLYLRTHTAWDVISFTGYTRTAFISTSQRTNRSTIRKKYAAVKRYTDRPIGDEYKRSGLDP